MLRKATYGTTMFVVIAALLALPTLQQQCQDDADCDALATACVLDATCVLNECVFTANDTVCVSLDPCLPSSCPGLALNGTDNLGCLVEAAPNGTLCNDGLSCTSNNECIDGLCVGTPHDVLCDEGALCTSYVCEPLREVPTQGLDPGCNAIQQGDGTPCTLNEGFDLCRGPATCTQGECVAGELTCDDQDACTTDRCLPYVGCVHDDVVCLRDTSSSSSSSSSPAFTIHSSTTSPLSSPAHHSEDDVGEATLRSTDWELGECDAATGTCIYEESSHHGVNWVIAGLLIAVVALLAVGLVFMGPGVVVMYLRWRDARIAAGFQAVRS